MLRNFTLLTIILFLTCIVQSAMAQDNLFLTDKAQPQKIKVIRITSDGLLYKKWPAKETDSVDFLLPEEIEKIIMEDGVSYKFVNGEIKESFLYMVQNCTSIKYHPFSVAFSQTSFSIEQTLRKRNSIELNIGLIGLGKQYDNNRASGYFLKLGYKISAKPNIELQTKYVHPLNGAYLKPELAMLNYNLTRSIVDDNSAITYSEKKISSYGLILNVGKQWVWDNMLLFDTYVGVGYAQYSESADKFANGNKVPPSSLAMYQYAFIGGNASTPFLFTAGMRLGIHFSNANKKFRNVKRN